MQETKVIIDKASYEYVNGVLVFMMYDENKRPLGQAYFDSMKLTKYYGQNYYLAQMLAKLNKGGNHIYTNSADDLQTKMAIHEFAKIAEAIGAIESYDDITVEQIPDGTYFESGKLNIGAKGVCTYIPTYLDLNEIPTNTSIMLNKVKHNGKEIDDDTVIINASEGWEDSPYLAMDALDIPVNTKLIRHIKKYNGADPMITDTQTVMGLSKYLTACQIDQLLEMGYDFTDIIAEEDIIDLGLGEAKHQKSLEAEKAYYAILHDNVKELPSGKKVTIVDNRYNGGEELALESGLDYYIEIYQNGKYVELYAKGAEGLPVQLFALGNNQKAVSNNPDSILVNPEENEVYVPFEIDRQRGMTAEMFVQTLRAKVESVLMKEKSAEEQRKKSGQDTDDVDFDI